MDLNPARGCASKCTKQVRTVVTQPHGMFIVCGPTGAGKSTTLYACLNSRSTAIRKTSSPIENPVEYQIPNVTQIEVNPKAGKTFASELRSILRQDPDVIIHRRNPRSGNGGNRLPGGPDRPHGLHHAARQRYRDRPGPADRPGRAARSTIASAVSAVLSQRLVRVLCPKCKVRYKPNPDMLRKANLPADKIKFFYRPPEPEEINQRASRTRATNRPFAAACGGTGLSRAAPAYFELLVVTDRIRDLIRENPNLNAIKQEAVKSRHEVPSGRRPSPGHPRQNVDPGIAAGL